MSSRNPTLDEFANDAIDGALELVYKAHPGVVTAYDPATQKASVQPIPMVSHFDESGARVVQQLPVVPGVPVVFPGGAGFTVVFPISVGDTVLLVYSDTSLDKWLAGAAKAPVDPANYARHTIADAIAIPGLRSFGAARPGAPYAAEDQGTPPGAPQDFIKIGRETGSAQGAALGDSIDAFVNGATPSPSTDASCLRGFLAAVSAYVNGIAPGTLPIGGPSAPPGALTSGSVKITG